MNETKNTDHPQAWKVHSRKTIYRDPWVSVAALDVETPGHERFDYRCVQLPEVAVAAVVDDMRRVLMLWRYRVLPQRWGWELPGGIIDEAKREQMPPHGKPRRRPAGGRTRCIT